MGRPCQVGRCTRHDAERCGTTYACPPCREQIDRLATQYQHDAEHPMSELINPYDAIALIANRLRISTAVAAVLFATCDLPASELNGHRYLKKADVEAYADRVAVQTAELVTTGGVR